MDTARFRLGALRFTPSIVVSDIGIDTNVFNEEVDPKRDTTAAVGPGIAAWLRLGRARLSGNATAQYLYYREYENQRSWNSSNDARLDIFLNRLTPFVAARYANTRQRLGFEIDARARRQTTQGRIGTELRLTGKVRTVVSASREIVAFDSNEMFFGTNLAETLDRQSDTAQVQFRYAMTPLTTFVINGEGGRDRFDVESLRDSNSLRVMSGFELNPFALIAGSAFVGVRRFDVLDERVPDFQGVVAAADVSYVLRTTQISGRVNRDISYSFERTAPYYTLTDRAVEVTERITYTWDLLARIGWQTLDYKTITMDTLLPRVDHGRIYGAGIRYRFNDTTSLGFDANLVRRTSPASNRSFEGLRFGATVSYGTSQRPR